MFRIYDSPLSHTLNPTSSVVSYFLFSLLFSSHPSYTCPAARWSCDQGGRRAIRGPRGSVPAPPHQRGGCRSGRAPLQHHPGGRYRHQVRPMKARGRSIKMDMDGGSVFRSSTRQCTTLRSHSTHTLTDRQRYAKMVASAQSSSH